MIIGGAGPVGLLLANLLGARALRVLVLEKRAERGSGSMAIGITPPSLAILRRLGLDQELVRRGVPVRQAFVHGRRGLLGSLSFDHLPGRYPFILSLPLSETLAVLEESLRRFPSVTLRRGSELSSVDPAPSSVTVAARERRSRAVSIACAAFLAGCDGPASAVRRLAGIGARHKDYGQSFLMADFEDGSGLGQEAHLFFTAQGSVESFPLPRGRRRWIVQTDAPRPEPEPGELERTVKERTGHVLQGAPKFFESPFRAEHLLAETFHRGRVVLAGDAAHVMSPIGGQGMNTGLADAELLAEGLEWLCQGRCRVEPRLEAYEAVRRRAFGVASARAARGMWLGTRRGDLAARLRDLLIRQVLLRPPVRRRLPAYFAMLTIPLNNLVRGPEDSVPRSEAGPAVAP